MTNTDKRRPVLTLSRKIKLMKKNRKRTDKSKTNKGKMISLAEIWPKFFYATYYFELLFPYRCDLTVHIITIMCHHEITMPLRKQGQPLALDQCLKRRRYDLFICKKLIIVICKLVTYGRKRTLSKTQGIVRNQ